MTLKVEPRTMTESITLMDQGGKFSPAVRYIVIRSKTAPIPVRWSFLLFVLTIPFESMDLSFTSASRSLAKLSGFLFFGCYLLFYGPLFGKRPFPRPHPILWWFVGYLAIYLMSALFTDPQFTGPVLVRVVTFLQLVTLLWVTTDLLKNQKMRESVLLAYSMSAVYLALGIIFGLPGFAVRSGPDGRVSAIGYDVNGLAGIIGLAMLILIDLNLKKVFKHFLSRILFPVLTLPLLLVLVKTGSRTGILAVLIGSLVYLLPCWRSKQSMTVIILVICGIGTLLYLIATDSLMMERWRQAQGGNLSMRQLAIPAALGMISERPIFGWHPIEFACEIGARIGIRECLDAHNLLFNMLVEVGVVGTIPFFIGLWLCFRAAWMARRGDLGLMPLALLSAILTVNMAIPALLWKPFWLVMGLTLAAASTATMQQARYRRVFLVRAFLKRGVLSSNSR